MKGSLLTIPLIYLAASLVTFIVYALDKSAAKAGKRRTPEKTLHTLALIGGWPGALLAQKKLRHKTQKQPFRTIFWLTVAINITVLITTVIQHMGITPLI